MCGYWGVSEAVVHHCEFWGSYPANCEACVYILSVSFSDVQVASVVVAVAPLALLSMKEGSHVARMNGATSTT